MNVDGGGYILTPDQAAAWEAAYPDEYKEYVEAGLYDPTTGELFDIPEWMNDGNAGNGPFDFALAPSHNTIGW